MKIMAQKHVNTEGDSSLWSSPLSINDTTSENGDEDILETCLRELEEKSVCSQNSIRPFNLKEKDKMHGMQISNHSSYSHQQHSNTTNNNQHHHQQTSSYSTKSSYRSTNSSHGASRNGGSRQIIQPPEEFYDFGSVKYSSGHSTLDNGSVKSSRSYRDDRLDEEYMDSFNENASYVSNLSQQSEPVHRYTSNGYSTKATNQNSRSRSLPRARTNGYASHSQMNDETYDEELSRYNSSTLPRGGVRLEEEPPVSSTPLVEPLSEAIVEEERHNADGTTSLIRRIVTATTTRVFHENQVPKVEVHISPATETIIDPHHYDDDDNESVMTTGGGPQLNSTSHTEFEHYHQQQQQRLGGGRSMSRDQNMTSTMTSSSTHRSDGVRQQRDGYDYEGTSFRGSELDYDASGSHLDYSGHEDYDRRNNIHNNQMSNTTTTTTTTKNDHYINESSNNYNSNTSSARGRTRQRDVRHNNSRQPSVSSYNSRDRIADEDFAEISINRTDTSNDRMDAVHGAGNVSGFYHDSSATSRKEQKNTSSSSGASSGSGLRMASQQQMTTSSQHQQQSSSSSSRQQREQYQQNSSSAHSTLDIKLKGKKSSNDIDISLLDLLMYLKTSDRVLKANTAGYIMHLTFNDDEAKQKIREFDIIPLLVKLLDHEDEDCQRNAAGALRNLSYGKFVNDNKIAIYECGGIEACVRLLYRTSWIEVRQHVTGILCNLSSYESLKLHVLREAMEAVALLIIVPLSGWEKDHAMMGRRPGIISWSLLLRNATGILRNVSSAGHEARTTIRFRIEGLVDACLWILRAAVGSEATEDINNKIIENIMCTLRNISYKIDVEIDRNVYTDAVRVPVKHSNANSPQMSPSRDHRSTNQDGDSDSVDNGNHDNNKKNKKNRLIPRDASKTGCLGMKKKPFKKRMENRGTLPLQPSKKPPPEQWAYHPPHANDKKYTPMGVELLWQPNTVTIYIYVITNSTNPLTLESAAAAVHNLTGGKWNWAALLRVHVRLNRGLPPLHDLLSVDQEYVVRSVAYALRNLAIDHTNKWSIGWFAPEGLVQVLPSVKAYETDTKPSEYTICAILSVLQALVYKDYNNSKKVKEADGIRKLVALTREEPREQKNDQLRSYSNKVIIDANRVLLYMWEFKDCRESIKKLLWSHSKAEDGEKVFKQNTLKNPHKGDQFADVDQAEEREPIAERDERRYVSFEQPNDDRELSFNDRPPEYEMREFGHQDVPSDEADENDTLIRRSLEQKKKKTPSAGASKGRNRYDGEENEESRLMTSDR
ncbi:uncharacterized protein [Clytia hemisphaerica]|uniref:uncharacterized protein isoform X3 n=1 Tax=Clytia hemisphaerica TaxID=252671 RepID=UPI0034D77302